MVNLFVFEKATNKVVAIIQGPDGVSCEHYAGHTDESGKQPYCSSDLGWQFEKFDENGEAMSPHTLKPREIREGEMVNPLLVYEHKHEGVVVGRYVRQLSKKQLAGKAPIPENDPVLVHDHHDLHVDDSVPVIVAPQFDDESEAGTPGGPHRMSQAQFAHHVKQTQEELAKAAKRHGLKLTALAFVLLSVFLANSVSASVGGESVSNTGLFGAFGVGLVGVLGLMINIATRNSRANLITTALGASATVRAYNGTPPASPDTALSGNTLLAQGTYAATPYPGCSNGTMTSNAITGANAAASGAPTFYGSYATDGTTRVLQHNTTDFVVTPASLTSGVAVSWSAIVHTEPVGT